MSVDVHSYVHTMNKTCMYVDVSTYVQAYFCTMNDICTYVLTYVDVHMLVLTYLQYTIPEHIRTYMRWYLHTIHDT